MSWSEPSTDAYQSFILSSSLESWVYTLGLYISSLYSPVEMIPEQDKLPMTYTRISSETNMNNTHGILRHKKGEDFSRRSHSIPQVTYSAAP